MKLTEDKLRQIIREELDLRKGNQPNPNSANGYLQKFLETTARRFYQELRSNFDIEFSDSVATKLSMQTDFQIYSQKQDRYKEGRMFMYVMKENNSLRIEAQGGPLGASISEMRTFIETEIPPSQDPLQEVRPARAFKTLM